MNLVTQFKGKVQAYKIEENEQGYLLSFLLKNEEVVTFQCTPEWWPLWACLIDFFQNPALLLDSIKGVPMKSIFAIAFFALAACGSAEQLAESLDKLSATPAPTAQPGIVWTATPLPAPTPAPTATPIPKINRSAYDDYKKVSEGMTREEVLLILGDFHRKKDMTHCFSGKCEVTEYLTWLYKDGALNVSIRGGYATYISAM